MSDTTPLEITNETCPAVTYQKAAVCVPVQVTPYAHVGKTVTKCCGAPVIKPGIQPCTGTHNGSIYFTLSQEICIAVPVEFGAVASVSETFVQPIGSSSHNLCSDCDDSIL